MSAPDTSSEELKPKPYTLTLFKDWDYARLKQETDHFIAVSGLDCFTKYIRRGAKLAEDPEVTLESVNTVSAGDPLDTYLSGRRIPVTLIEKAALELENSAGRWAQFRQQPWRLYALIACCAMGAAVQGWDESAVNGAQLGYIPYFSIASRYPIIGLVNGAPYLCCLFSCLLTGPLNRIGGRKVAIAITCAVSAASCLGQAFSRNWWHLFIARLFLGLGVGPKSATIPIYAAECVPERIRGALVMQWQMWTACGLMLGLISSVALREANESWRLMLGGPMILPLLLSLLVFSLPESPRWYLQRAHASDDIRTQHKYYRKAYNSMCALRPTELQAARDLFLIDHLLLKETIWARGSRAKGLWKILRCRRALIASLITMFLQQFCGVNILAYYSSSVFVGALSDKTVSEFWSTVDTNTYYKALELSLIFGFLNFIFALPAVWYIDIIGRRSLLLATFPFMALFQFIVGMSFFAKGVSQKVLVGVFSSLFTVAYSVGEGPVPFLYSAESLPLFNRDIGMGLITAINWGLNFLVAMTWPPMVGGAHEQGAFGFYAFWCLAGFFMVLLFVPETKNYTLEELDEVFEKTYPEHMRHGINQVTQFLRKYLLHQRHVKMPELIVKGGEAEERDNTFHLAAMNNHSATGSS